jgi:hypothetical protein
MNKTYYEIEKRWSDRPDVWDTPNYERVDEKYFKFPSLEQARAAVEQWMQVEENVSIKEPRVMEWRIVKRTEMVTVKDEEVINFPNPRAGKSDDAEWLKLREFNVYKKILNEEWAYSDFDCWLAARDRHHVKIGEERAWKALKDFQDMHDIKCTPKY